MSDARLVYENSTKKKRNNVKRVERSTEIYNNFIQYTKDADKTNQISLDYSRNVTKRARNPICPEESWVIIIY